MLVVIRSHLELCIFCVVNHKFVYFFPIPDMINIILHHKLYSYIIN